MVLCVLGGLGGLCTLLTVHRSRTRARRSRPAFYRVLDQDTLLHAVPALD